MAKVFWFDRIILAAIILFLAAGCKKEEITGDLEYKVTHWPVVKALDVTNITDSTATLNGTVNTYGLSTTVTFEYGTTASYDSIVPAYQIPVSGSGIINVSANISGLTLCMPYHFRVRAENSLWTNFYSSDKAFSIGQMPDAHTTDVTNIYALGATLNGTVNACGLPATVTFEYGPATSYCNTLTANPGIVKGAFTTSVSADITGLTAGTTYHFRVRAEKSCGTTYGNYVEFTIYAPTATTLEATNLTSTTATLNGIVNANNLPSVVTFEYGTTTNYGQSVSSEPSHATGDTVTSVSTKLTGLPCGAIYHFRIKAENSLGVVYGSDLTFETKKIPTLTTTSVTDITATTAISGGTITDDGCSPITDRGVIVAAIGPSYREPGRPSRIFHAGTGTGSFTINLTGLSPSKWYTLQAYATNSAGTAYGDWVNFKTSSSGK